MEIEQKGIKWWKDCLGCGWVGRSTKPDNDNEECPNCGNPDLRMNIDDHVFDGRRFGRAIHCDADVVVEVARLAAAGEQPVRLDRRVHPTKPGHVFAPGKKPNYRKKNE